MFVTHVDRDIKGDVFFPEYNEKHWKIISAESRQTEGGLPYRFVDYELSR
jgi:dihydrofolate reductase